jgi:hypothetical protein
MCIYYVTWFLCPEFCLLQSCLHHYKIWASHSSDHVEYSHLLCDVLWYVIYVPYWMNLLPPTSIFDPEDGGSRFFLNVSITSQMAVILYYTDIYIMKGTLCDFYQIHGCPVSWPMHHVLCTVSPEWARSHCAKAHRITVLICVCTCKVHPYIGHHAWSTVHWCLKYSSLVQ